MRSQQRWLVPLRRLNQVACSVTGDCCMSASGADAVSATCPNVEHRQFEGVVPADGTKLLRGLPRCPLLLNPVPGNSADQRN